jgi:hypothetical protein
MLLSQVKAFKIPFSEETHKIRVLKGVSVHGTSETPWKFWNVVLEKDGNDQLDWSCEK